MELSKELIEELLEEAEEQAFCDTEKYEQGDIDFGHGMDCYERGLYDGQILRARIILDRLGIKFTISEW